MKREIKFRAWDKACKVIHFMLEKSHKLPLPQPLHTYLENTERFEIMQFTGLQDINGKDIYEGDILCVPHLENTRHQVRIVIEWDNDNAEYTKYYPKNAFEIIGNIYENPELLNNYAKED